MKKLPVILLIIFLVGGCSSVGKTPEPVWSSVRKDGNIEIRAYDAMIVAEATTTGERYAAINEGFRILAAYIFGENTVQKKIAMTAPVTQQAGKPQSQKIAMTAPVTQDASKKPAEWNVRFVMPGNYPLETLPRPKDKRINILEIPAFKAVVICFSGFNTDNNLHKHETELMAWIKKNNIKISGNPIYAFYNPPWTPPFLKRNEVMIKILD